MQVSMAFKVPQGRYYNQSNLIEIGRLLIENGADVNAQHMKTGPLFILCVVIILTRI
jgi:hypothetical protein